jgi:acyl-coenzyme A synthetase/AMP-(fatty) acid ligase
LHPFIAGAAVVPSPDEYAAEVAKSFSVLRSPLAVEEVLTFVAAGVSPHKKIRGVEFVERLGKGLSSTGVIPSQMCTQYRSM